MVSSAILISVGFGIVGCEGPAERQEAPSSSAADPADGTRVRREGATTDTTAARGGGTTDAAPTNPGGGPSVLFFGTSLTAGYGLEAPDAAFPAVIQEKIDSAGFPYQVVNAGVPGETSAAGLRRIGWVLDHNDVAAVVLELGANDGLRGQDPDALRSNLEAAIDSVRAHEPDAAVVLAGMEAPPNLGPRYTGEFRAVFQEVARAEDAALIPFLLEGVAGIPELNQDDRIHPTEEGHRIVAENVWTVLAPVLRSRISEEDR